MTKAVQNETGLNYQPKQRGKKPRQISHIEEPMKELNELNDGELEELVLKIRSVLSDRQAERRRVAIEQASEILKKAGVDPGELTAVKRKRAEKPLPAGKRYKNPTNPKQVWVSGRGRRPSWVKALEKKGQLPDPE